MTEQLTIDGLSYISIRDAAVSSRLSTEYLARLARSGRIRARMIGRTWFIETDSLQQFLSTRTAIIEPATALSALTTQRSLSRSTAPKRKYRSQNP
jgi:excisionase family DNA binding protein